MKTLSLLAAAAVALSLSVSGTSAATFKPNPGPIPGTPVTLSAVKYLACKVVSPLPPKTQLDLATLRITNNAGVALKKGMRIYVNYQLKNGLMQKTSAVLSKDVPAGASFDAQGGGTQCTAQVNLLAKLEQVPTAPVLR